MSNTWTRAPQIIAVVAVLLLGACGESDYLDGTISDRFSLTYDKLRLRKQGRFLLVEYIRRTYEATETVCKLAVDTSGMADQRHFEGQDFLDRVSLTRATIERSDFPDIEQGSLDLSEFEFEHDGAVSGKFFINFKNLETLTGRFSGNLVEIQLQ